MLPGLSSPVTRSDKTVCFRGKDKGILDFVPIAIGIGFWIGWRAFDGPQIFMMVMVGYDLL
jgi:hypothetical protein